MFLTGEKVFSAVNIAILTGEKVFSSSKIADSTGEIVNSATETAFLTTEILFLITEKVFSNGSRFILRAASVAIELSLLQQIDHFHRAFDAAFVNDLPVLINHKSRRVNSDAESFG